MDKAGRVVIPKTLRDRAGLKPGGEIDIDFDRNQGGVLLSAPPPEGRLVREGGLLVWESAPGTPKIQPEEIKEAIRTVREDRKNF